MGSMLGRAPAAARALALAAAALLLGALAAPATAAAAGTQAMWRLYNPNTGEHFYTASAGERDSLARVGWRKEGQAWTAPTSSGTPVYRLYNPVVRGGDHHYTTSAGERDALVRVGWRAEGVGWYSDDARGVPLQRLYNPNAATGTHHYTVDTNERDSLRRAGWRYEGVAWYGVAPGGSGASQGASGGSSAKPSGGSGGSSAPAQGGSQQQAVYRTVTFDSRGGGAVAARRVRDGEPVGDLPVPARAGYAFQGWYTAASGGSKVSSGTVVTKSMTLYARWEHAHDWQPVYREEPVYGEKQVWVPELEYVRHEAAECSKCGMRFDSFDAFYRHSDEMWEKGEDHGAYINQSWTEWVDNGKGHYETERVQTGTKKVLDRYACSCGAVKAA